jgi:hypothetical protein
MKQFVVKQLHPRSPDLKYVGEEPTWNTQPSDDRRVSAVVKAFNWYNYHYSHKEAKEMIVQWLESNGRPKDAKKVKSLSESFVHPTIGWLCRANLVGLELTDSELAVIEKHLAEMITVREASNDATIDTAEPKVTIQDRLREKVIDCAGELDGMFDDFIKNGCKLTADIKPIAVIRAMNIAPQMVSYISDMWTRERAEFAEVIKGEDKQLVEGYSSYTKIQMRNMLKFADLILSDCASYLQAKKSERKPRAKKAVSPEKQAVKFKFLLEFSELKLKSIPPAKLVNATEAWLYDTKKRKLIHVVADQYAKTFTVKGTTIVGIDEAQTVQKTLRKPATQLKELFSGGKPATRKYFADIKSTDVKFNGRSNENIVILKVW